MPANSRTLLGRAAAALVLLLPVPRPSMAARLPLEELPVESPRYQDIEDLAVSHGFGAAFLATRPWSRADLAAFLDSLAARAPGVASDPAFRRLAREARRADDRRDPGPAVALADGDRALEASPYARFGWSEDHGAGSLAHDDRAGGRVAFAPGPGLLVAGDVYAGTHTPGGHGNPANSRRFALVEGADFNSYYDRATVFASGRIGSARLGHTWLRWGPGDSGTLGLSDAAPALDLLELRVAPWRRLQLTWFVAQLDPLADTWLAGHRLEARPTAGLDVGVSELARFDGAASAPLYLVPLVPFSHVEKRELTLSSLARDSATYARDKNNVLWTADLDWRVSPGARAWGELVVDDLSFGSTWRPSSIGWQAGLQGRRRLGGGALSARAEVTRIHRFTYSVEHHHDFVSDGLPLGYAYGPDVEHVALDAGLEAGPDWTLLGAAEQTLKGEAWLGDAWSEAMGRVDAVSLTGVVERTRRASLGLRWTPSAALEALATGGWCVVDDAGHVPGASASGPVGALRIDVRY